MSEAYAYIHHFSRHVYYPVSINENTNYTICKVSFDSFLCSTLLGSGLLVLSQHPLERTGFHSFALWGSPEDAVRYQLDCLCGKGVAYAVVRFNGLSLVLFNTHVRTAFLSAAFLFLCPNASA